MAVLPSQEPIVESAVAFRLRRAPTIDIRLADLPGKFEVDPSRPAIPIGGGVGGQISLANAQPEESAEFLVSGSIEVESMATIPEDVDGRRVIADPVIEPFLTCGGSSPVMTSSDVATKLKVAALAAKGLTGQGVAIAIMDTGINIAHLNAKLGGGVKLDAANSLKPSGPVTTLPGNFAVGHGTMCAFDALIAAPQATLLDFPILSSRAPGGAQMSGTIGTALLAYSQLLSSWAVTFAPGAVANYRGLVVNNSWGMFTTAWDFPVGHPGRYCDNPNHPFHMVLAALAAAGADIVFAAGNCGADCPDGRCDPSAVATIMGANAHPDVLSIAGCDLTGLRVGYSSQGPSIAGMSPQKPDVTTYTHFLGSDALGLGSPDSGTSAASPVAAGCVAALRSKASPRTIPPANLFHQLRAAASAVGGSGGWNGDYGFGILDPLAAANAMGL
jgi:subtilisin family serine protease